MVPSIRTAFAKAFVWWLSSIHVHVIALNQSFNPAVIGNIKEQVASAVVSRHDSFVVALSLGTPAQQLKCLVDSGSADLWVPSKRCANCVKGNHFFADASSTFAPMQYAGRPVPETVSYGSGEVAGYGATETLTLGPWTIKNQSFIIVEDQNIPRSLEWDGIFGLGWRGLSRMAKPVYQRMQEAGHPAMFALVPQKNHVAKLVLGQVPQEIKTSTLVWTPCETMPDRTGNEHHGFWIVSGGVAITLDKPKPAKFLVDTGTNQMLLVPSQWYLDFIRSLTPPLTFHSFCGMDMAMGNIIICDCRIGQNSSALPLRLYLGERQFVIPLAELFRKVSTTDGRSNVCMLEIQPNDIGPEGLDGMLNGLLPGIVGGMVPGMGMPMSSSSLGAGMPMPPNGPMPPRQSPTAGDPQNSAQQPFPFLPPGFLPPPPGGSGAAPTMPNPRMGQEVEEVMQTLPNGTVCTTMVKIDLKTQEKKVTKTCNNQRRLQPQQTMGIPMLPPMVIPVQVNPVQDLWVLGGVFMEKFVTIFDFDHKQVGFAELTTAVSNEVSTHAVIQDFRVQDEDKNALVLERAYAARDVPVQHSQQAWSLGMAVPVMLSLVLFFVGFLIVRQRALGIGAQRSDAESDVEPGMEACE
mmetsp:Transcript_31990/g.49806  ORF Transcript_31990/g.49806 Transcript_31990/m.49806 type:complete len:632 (-) Transcript_31990:206-2101(-)